MSLFFSLVPISPPFLPDMPPLSLSLFHTHTHAHTHSLSLPHSPTTTRPNMNFWQEPGSLFNCQCYRECPHKSNVVMPLKRLLALAITDTHTHTQTIFSSLSPTFFHVRPKHMHNRSRRCDVWEWGLWGCLRSRQTQQLQCLFAISTGSGPLRQTHGNLWISIFSKSCWASECITEQRKKECNECREVVYFYVVFFWCILYSIVYSGGWWGVKRDKWWHNLSDSPTLNHQIILKYLWTHYMASLAFLLIIHSCSIMLLVLVLLTKDEK